MTTYELEAAEKRKTKIEMTYISLGIALIGIPTLIAYLWGG